MRETGRPPSPGHLRVMTWNIHKGVGGVDRRYQLQRTIEVIRHYDPDVALLQEVAQGMKSLRRQDQVQVLEQSLGLYVAFHPEHQYQEGGYGNLILARWPIFRVTHLDLTMGWRKRRGMLGAHVRSHIGQHQRALVVHNLHLGLTGSERKRQLARFMASPEVNQLHQDTPTLIGGDFNDLYGSLGPQFLLPAGFERAGALANTFPAALPLRPLDGLFFRGGLRLTHAAVGRSQLARMASDHLPLYADFELLPA